MTSPRKSREEVLLWPAEMEQLLLEGLERYKPTEGAPRTVDRTNRLISDYIFEMRGERRTPEQIGLRIEQLNATKA
ncbi:hypothetical protein C8Q75DRAFT_767560 [Abortiporus biennis]|nr:hypothetical protein C8Q75DRAFT_767560 [Abortiporus biennis]